MKKEYEQDEEYMRCVADILTHPVFLQLDSYTQHGNTSRKEHCISVSYRGYRISRRLGLDYMAVARAGLLHDLFLYDWHDKDSCCNGKARLHGFRHPRVALETASRYFKLNEMERNIILRHMFPLTLIPPKHLEGLIINFSDESNCVQEVAGSFMRKLRNRKPVMSANI